MDLPIFTLFGQADAAAAPLDLLASAQDFVSFATMHWRFCLLHFLEFAVWGAWFVVLGNMLNARGFSRSEIGRIYSTMPIGSMIAPLFMAVLADKYFNTEVLIAVSHLIGGRFALHDGTHQPGLAFLLDSALLCGALLANVEPRQLDRVCPRRRYLWR